MKQGEKKIGKVQRPDGWFVYVKGNGDVMAFKPKKTKKNRRKQK